MAAMLPEYFFRVRENGAFVFRVDTENRQRRIDMDQIAAVNIRNGEIKPHGGRALSETDLAQIKTWMQERRAVLAARDIDDIMRVMADVDGACAMETSDEGCCGGGCGGGSKSSGEEAARGKLVVATASRVLGAVAAATPTLAHEVIHGTLKSLLDAAKIPREIDGLHSSKAAYLALILATPALGGAFSRLTLMSQWNEMLKVGVAALEQDSLIHKVTSNTLSAFDKAQLVRAGVGDADLSRLADMGWRARVGLQEGIAETYQWFLDNQDTFRR